MITNGAQDVDKISGAYIPPPAAARLGLSLLEPHAGTCKHRARPAQVPNVSRLIGQTRIWGPLFPPVPLNTDPARSCSFQKTEESASPFVIAAAASTSPSTPHHVLNTVATIGTLSTTTKRQTLTTTFQNASSKISRPPCRRPLPAQHARKGARPPAVSPCDHIRPLSRRSSFRWPCFCGACLPGPRPLRPDGQHCCVSSPSAVISSYTCAFSIFTRSHTQTTAKLTIFCSSLQQTVV